MAPVQSQPIVAQLTRAAIFLVVKVNPGPEPRAAVRGLCADLAALLRAVGFRDLEGRLSCVMGFGSEAWDSLFGAPRPRDLHPFREIRGQHHAVSTPGDLLFHIRAVRMDLCFEMATLIMSRLGNVVCAVGEVHGFNYFYGRGVISDWSFSTPSPCAPRRDRSCRSGSRIAGHQGWRGACIPCSRSPWCAPG